MNITRIFSFLVHPAKALADEDRPPIGGARIPKTGKLFRMLKAMFDRSNSDCIIDVAFNLAADGSQDNPCRTEVMAAASTARIAAARVLATRLQSITTHRSGLGLLFIIIAKDGSRRKIHISRFPADMGILAEERKNTLRVEFLERVFMRHALAYKAVVYEGKPVGGDFWDGKAVDRQINSRDSAISHYWIREFLVSDFKTTPKLGTRRLAISMRKALANSDSLEVKDQIIAAAKLARSLNGKSISIDNFADRFQLAPDAKDAILREVENPALRFDHFQFSFLEFNKNLPYRSIDLDNGATLTAATPDFDDCFKKREIEDSADTYEFSTTGKVVKEKLRKTK